jgi:hypothetical protein
MPALRETVFAAKLKAETKLKAEICHADFVAPDRRVRQ